MALILRGAELALGASNEVLVRVPDGSPLLDRMADEASRRPLRTALSERLGRPVELEFTTDESAQSDRGLRRITAEGARQERLRRLTAEEPLLNAAVQAWDLELME
jgi:hypothetical protein